MEPSKRRERLAAARLYFIADDAPGGRALGPVLEAALQGGIDLFQLRCKDRPDEEILAAAAVAREACDRAGALFIINDRPDLAALAGADGVHVGQDDLEPGKARALAGPGALVGLSTHTPAQVDEAAGVDYIGVGPVHATPTKLGRPAAGTELVRHAASAATVPFFAIGGIDATNIEAVLAAGAERIAVVRAISEASDPRGAATALAAALGAVPVGGSDGQA